MAGAVKVKGLKEFQRACNKAPKDVKHGLRVRLEKVGDGFAITHSDLVCVAKIPGIDDKTFQQIAEQTKSGCPVSKVLNAKISLAAKLG